MPGKIAIPLLITVNFICPCSAADSDFRFLAVGDVPYSQEQYGQFLRLLSQSKSEDFAFLMHTGDFKDGGTECSDTALEKIAHVFQSYPKPIVYTPGDNEWTDCHRTGDDPIERLQKLRELFFQNPDTLRLSQLKVEHQNRNPQFKAYIENYRFVKSNVLFIATHIVGSNNNYRPDHPPSMEEFNRRNRANLAFMKESFARAIEQKVSAVVVMIHANPDFEMGNSQGFKDFLLTMRRFLTKYHRPVICIHGDSHYFRIDKPLVDNKGLSYLHFTRVEVFGWPNVAGLSISVNPTSAEVFTYHPYYLKQTPDRK